VVWVLQLNITGVKIQGYFFLAENKTLFQCVHGNKLIVVRSVEILPDTSPTGLTLKHFMRIDLTINKTPGA
jgi:hypothetical protein